MANKLRGILALVLLAILVSVAVIASAGQLLRLAQQAQAAKQNSDDLTHWGERLAPLIPYLPDTGELGYISERNIPGVGFSATDLGEEFAMSQYVLAPRILVEGTDHALVVGNIGSIPPDEIPAAVAPLGLKLERVFSYGIYLFKRVGP